MGADQGIQLLHEEPNALLIIEWNETTGLALAMLEENLKIPQLIPRPILLICHGEVETLEGLASEFNISQIYLGDINKNGIKEKLEVLRDAEYIEKEVREQYQSVTDIRESEGWEKSKDLLVELVTKYPNDERLQLELAENYFRLNQIAEAKKVLEPMTTKQKPLVRALNLYGRCLLKDGAYDEASKVLQNASFINPNNVDRLLNLGDAFIQAGRYRKAKDAYERASQLAPYNEDAIKGAGKASLLDDDITNALSYIKQLSDTREMASTFNTAAVIAISDNRFKQGMSLYKIAVDTIDEDYEILSKLAFNMALGFYRQNNNAFACMAFGISHVLDGSNEKAKINYEKLNEKNPQDLPGSQAEALELLKAFDNSEDIDQSAAM